MELSVHTYEAHHYTLINDWLQERQLSTILPFELPQDGIMIYGRNGYIAGGFIRKCEGGIALVDSYITNPNVDGKVRDAALDLMTNELLRVAKERGYTRMIAFTEDLHTFERGLAHGFDVIDQAMLGKRL
jgi:hypothetical protein